jgi:polyadenylate-binding protein
VFVGKFVRRKDRSESGELNPKFNNVFIKNLPKEVDEEKLKTMFEVFGPVVSVAVKHTEDTGKGASSFGFVCYENTDDAAKAVDEMNNKEVGCLCLLLIALDSVRSLSTPHSSACCSRCVSVLVDAKTTDGPPIPCAFFKLVDKRADIPPLSWRVQVDGKTLFVGRHQKKAEREAELRQKFEALRQERANKFQGVNLYVKNLDDQVDDDRLRSEFAAFGTLERRALVFVI